MIKRNRKKPGFKLHKFSPGFYVFLPKIDFFTKILVKALEKKPEKQ